MIENNKRTENGNNDTTQNNISNKFIVIFIVT